MWTTKWKTKVGEWKTAWKTAWKTGWKAEWKTEWICYAIKVNEKTCSPVFHKFFMQFFKQFFTRRLWFFTWCFTHFFTPFFTWFLTEFFTQFLLRFSPRRWLHGSSLNFPLWFLSPLCTPILHFHTDVHSVSYFVFHHIVSAHPENGVMLQWVSVGSWPAARATRQPPGSYPNVVKQTVVRPIDKPGRLFCAKQIAVLISEAPAIFFPWGDGVRG